MSTIQFTIVDPALISTNDMYMHPVRKCKDGRYRSYVCKAPYLKETQEFYKEKLEVAIPQEMVDELKKFIDSHENSGLSLTLEIGFPERQLYEHDCSNFIKALEDCIATRLKIDDSRNFKVSAEKFVSPSDQWYLRVFIEPHNLKLFQGGAEYR